MSIECDLRRAADMTVVEDLSRQRRNMLYVSRGQLKKNSNTAVNVCVSVRYISQQVHHQVMANFHFLRAVQIKKVKELVLILFF